MKAMSRAVNYGVSVSFLLLVLFLILKQVLNVAMPDGGICTAAGWMYSSSAPVLVGLTFSLAFSLLIWAERLRLWEWPYLGILSHTTGFSFFVLVVGCIVFNYVWLSVVIPCVFSASILYVVHILAAGIAAVFWQGLSSYLAGSFFAEERVRDFIANREDKAKSRMADIRNHLVEEAKREILETLAGDEEKLEQLAAYYEVVLRADPLTTAGDVANVLIRLHGVRRARQLVRRT